MAKTKTAKLETYGPRNCPLVRSSHMTDAQWDAATLEFDDLMRRQGKRITWRTKFQRCAQCGATDLTKKGLRFGAASGLCMPCSRANVRELLAGLR
jgi:hypothetical protein